MLLAASGFAVAPALVLARGDDPPEPPEAHPVVTGLGRRRRFGGRRLSAVSLLPGLLGFATSLAGHWLLEANLQLRLRVGADNPR